MLVGPRSGPWLLLGLFSSNSPLSPLGDCDQGVALTCKAFLHSWSQGPQLWALPGAPHSRSLVACALCLGLWLLLPLCHTSELNIGSCSFFLGSVLLASCCCIMIQLGPRRPCEQTPTFKFALSKLSILSEPSGRGWRDEWMAVNQNPIIL